MIPAGYDPLSDPVAWVAFLAGVGVMVWAIVGAGRAIRQAGDRAISALLRDREDAR